ncbi:MAG: alkaline phosphatase family protein [Nitrospirae bacterium]|nr:alkaline phosphatase family protein [Nitrospirota bacterium]MCL5285427.1 alkaline phosphatase family protein [Nitrospirota bacterium]
MASHLVLLGLGGLSLELLDPLIHNGWLPNLEFLMGRGVVGSLSSDLPPYAATEWTTLLTGEGPGTTGFLEGSRKTPGSYFPEVASLRALARRSPRSLLARNSHETVLVGVPIPPAPGPRPPEEAVQLLRWQGGRFSVHSLPRPSDPEEGEKLPGSGEEDSGSFVERATRRMVALSVSMARVLRESGPRVVAIHFSGLDRILSRYHRDVVSALLGRSGRGLEDPLRQFFRAFDDAVGTALDLTKKPGSLVVLASAHGFSPVRRALNLNAFLLAEGHLGLRPEAGGESVLREVAAPVLRSMKIERTRVKRLLSRSRLKEVVDRTGALLSSEIGLFDWGRTRAFALSRTGITLNVRGVESKGTVNPGPEERELGERIRRSLLDLVDPVTGKRPVREVMWREELFEGPGLPELPHLIVRDFEPDFSLEDWRNVSPGVAIFSDPLPRTGTPRSPGFYCFSGRPLPEALRLPRPLTLVELSGMILSALGTSPLPLSGEIPQGS